MEKFAYDVARKNVEYLLLDRLSLKPMHGYALIREIRRDHGVYLGASTVYPALHKLEEEGLIVRRWDMADRPRRVCEITNEGQKQLDKARIVIQQIMLNNQRNHS